MIATRALAVFAAAVVAVVAAAVAQAHAFLDHANPAVGSSVPSAPTTLTLWFTQQLEPAFTTANVTNASGAPVSAGAAQIDPQNPMALTVPLQSLPPGTYTVTWRALSVDTHTTQGHFSFAVER